MAKKVKRVVIPPTPKMTKEALANEKPFKIDGSFEDVMKKLITTPVIIAKKTKV